ncbi:MAG: hypothetical protein AB7F28_07980 [Candidatus Margulisiibacteriota bacterium]
MSTQVIHCIHGMIWQACHLCSDKTEEIVLSDLALQQEEASNQLLYDYQEAPAREDSDTDLDYDIEESSF